MINIDVMPQNNVQESLERASRSPVLLVACDFDGVIAEPAENPSDAKLDGDALAALVRLSELPCTHAAIVSGRSRADLSRTTGHPARIHLVGSHGAELPGAAPTPCPGGRLDSLVSQVVEVASRWSGMVIERKPYAVAIHHHAARDVDVDALIWALLNGPARLPGVHVRPAGKTFELCLAEADKGVALATLRQRTGATSAIFLGDEVAAGDAMRALGAGDLGLRVGTRLPGRHGAPGLVLDDVRAASEALIALARLRAAWATGTDHAGARLGQERDGQRRGRLGRDGLVTATPIRRVSCALLTLAGHRGMALA